MKLLVTLGYHAREGTENFDFKEAGIVLVDWEKRQIVRELTYISPTENAPPAGRMLFHSGQLLGARLVVTTSTEVVIVNIDDWRIEQVISLPHFNDLHHALLAGDSLFVCNTGLQAVHRLTLSGELLETYSTDDQPTWGRYSPDTDYRPLHTKPHAVHPNHLFVWNGALWVTRCQLKDAVQVLDHSRRLDIGLGNPHDGIPTKDLIYFTTINGYIVGIDPETGRHERVVDLNTMDPARGQLGWCRGLRLMGDQTAFVGFSQFRPSKSKDMVHWILKDGKARLPSRIALCDLNGPSVIQEMSFTGRYEGAAIYSIFALAD